MAMVMINNMIFRLNPLTLGQGFDVTHHHKAEGCTKLRIPIQSSLMTSSRQDIEK